MPGAIDATAARSAPDSAQSRGHQISAPLAFARPRLIRTGKHLYGPEPSLQHDLRRFRVRPAAPTLALARLDGAIPAAFADTTANVSKARRNHPMARQAPALPRLHRPRVRRNRLHTGRQHYPRGGLMSPFDGTRARAGGHERYLSALQDSAAARCSNRGDRHRPKTTENRPSTCANDR